MPVPIQLSPIITHHQSNATTRNGGGLTFSPDFGTRERPNFSIRRCNGQKLNSEVTLVRVAASVLSRKRQDINFSNRLREGRNGGIGTRLTWNDLSRVV